MKTTLIILALLLSSCARALPEERRACETKCGEYDMINAKPCACDMRVRWPK